jgi:hypothetical protein
MKMTDIQDQIIDLEPTERVTRRDLVEGKIGKVLDPEKSALVPMPHGVLQFDNAFQVGEAAKLMATAGPLLPPWLQGNVGGCWGIILRSTEIGISPLTLAAMTFITEKRGVQRLGYDSTYFRTMIEKFAPIKHRLMARYEGEGDDLVCIVYTTMKGETEPREFPPASAKKDFTLKKLHPGHNEYGAVKGSPLWDEKPALQMFYAMSRDWARMYCSDIVAGAYTREELAKAGYEETEKLRDTSPRLTERLRGQTGEGVKPGFLKAIDEAIAEASPGKKKSAAHSPTATDSGSAPPESETAPPSSHPLGSEGGVVIIEDVSKEADTDKTKSSQ